MKHELNFHNKLYCPNCKHNSDIKITGTIDVEIPFGKIKIIDNALRQALYCICPNCKESEMMILDKDIFDQVLLLNKKGYETLFSCEGHSMWDSGYIVFKDKTILNKIKKEYGCPEEWYMDNLIPKGDPDTIRTLNHFIHEKYYEIKGITFEMLKKKYLNTLDEWVKSLPDYTVLCKGGEDNNGY